MCSRLLNIKNSSAWNTSIVLSWTNNKFVFTIYNHYPKNRYYRAAPPGYQVYKGSNRYFDHSAYSGRAYGEPLTKSQPKPSTGGTQYPGMGKPGSKSQPGMMNKRQAVNEGKHRMNDRRNH